MQPDLMLDQDIKEESFSSLPEKKSCQVLDLENGAPKAQASYVVNI